MECVDNGLGLADSFSFVAGLLGLLVTLIPVYMWLYLRKFRQQDFKDKLHPDGEVTSENIKPEGEELGERLSQLDSKYMVKAFGFFYRSFERKYYWCEPQAEPLPSRSPSSLRARRNALTCKTDLPMFDRVRTTVALMS